MRAPSWLFGLVLLALLAVGCRRDASTNSRWEKAQRGDDREIASSSPPSEEDLSDEPPPWNPGGTSQEKMEPTGWKPSGTASNKPAQEPARIESRIDLEALKSGDPLAGGEFNRFFPKQGDGWDLVYKQEKSGFALASLQKGGEEMAMLSITDLRSNPEAAEKYVHPERQIASHPAASIGAKGDAVVVAGRFQVQVRSQSDQFTKRDREEWIRRFDLTGLSELK